MRYVIVGNSFAAVFAIEALRRVDQSGEIVVISAEEEHVYSRAMIPEWLAGLVDDRFLYLREPDFYERMGVTPLLGQRVTGLEAAQKRVLLGQRTIEYDKLLLTVGGIPFIPPGIEGWGEFEDVFTFTSLAEAKALRRAAEKAEQAVVLGAGLIGLQCAEALAHLGKKVTVVELANTVLPLALDELAAALIQRELEAEGLRIFTEDTIVSLQGIHGRLESVTLRSGRRVPCQLLVIAVGVRPNVEFLRSSGLLIDRGIIVNHHLETNLPEVYAAGDCAQGPEIISGQNLVLPLIPVASTQGLMAGYNLAGEKREFRGGLSLNAFQFGGLQVISYGFIRDEEGAEVLRRVEEGKRIYKKVILKDGRITGAIFVRAIDRAGLFRYLIEHKIEVREFKEHLLDDDFGIAHWPREERMQLFTSPP
ncbi:MAG TPA: NAD(P)/FAD-dependent oxidoreductase [Piscirickettsiaceae bacterium]|nr:NAD(P)/FAD-dependent oxidoreductase [Piscirickettsiaceae bacterium]